MNVVCEAEKKALEAVEIPPYWNLGALVAKVTNGCFYHNSRKLDLPNNSHTSLGISQNVLRVHRVSSCVSRAKMMNTDFLVVFLCCGHDC